LVGSNELSIEVKDQELVVASVCVCVRVCVHVFVCACVHVHNLTTLRKLENRTNAGIDSILKVFGVLHVKRIRESNIKMNGK
jgi:hypothetical protein